MTKRYRGLTRIIYARALIDLLELAREPAVPQFQFGPLQLSSLEQQGLTVTGVDLDRVSEVLGQVYGLTEVPA